MIELEKEYNAVILHGILRIHDGLFRAGTLGKIYNLEFLGDPMAVLCAQPALPPPAEIQTAVKPVSQVTIFKHEGDFQLPKREGDPILTDLAGPKGLPTLNDSFSEGIKALNQKAKLDRFRPLKLTLPASSLTPEILKALKIEAKEVNSVVLSVSAAFGGVTNLFDSSLLVNGASKPWEARSGALYFTLNTKSGDGIKVTDIEVSDSEVSARRVTTQSLLNQLEARGVGKLVAKSYHAKEKLNTPEVVDSSKQAVAEAFGIKDTSNIMINWGVEKYRAYNSSQERGISCIVMRAIEINTGSPITTMAYKINPRGESFTLERLVLRGHMDGNIYAVDSNLVVLGGGFAAK